MLDGRTVEAIDCCSRDCDEGDPQVAFALGQTSADLDGLENARIWFERVVDRSAACLRPAVVPEGFGLDDQSAEVLERAVPTDTEAAVGRVQRGRVTWVDVRSHLDRGTIAVAVAVAVLLANLDVHEGRIDEVVTLLRWVAASTLVLAGGALVGRAVGGPDIGASRTTSRTWRVSP